MSSSDFPVGNVFLAYPEGCGSNELPGWIEFSIFDRKLTKSGSIVQTIGLYMPESVVNPATVSWENESIGLGSHLRLSAAQRVLNNMDYMNLIGKMSGLNHMGALSQKQSEFQSTMTEAAKNMGLGVLKDAATVAASNSVRNFAGGGARLLGITNNDGGALSNSQATGVLSGKVFNPYLTAIFRGVDFRTFEFSFKFYPHNEKQCETIHNIIKAFRMAYLPKYSPSGSIKDGILDYPLEFGITYKWGTGDNKFVHKFKKSVMTGFDTNYTATGQWSSMKNSMPASINITMRFSEVEIVTRDDVKGGF